jgi:hypothetical protein
LKRARHNPRETVSAPCALRNRAQTDRRRDVKPRTTDLSLWLARKPARSVFGYHQLTTVS